VIAERGVKVIGVSGWMRLLRLVGVEELGGGYRNCARDFGDFGSAPGMRFAGPRGSAILARPFSRVWRLAPEGAVRGKADAPVIVPRFAGWGLSRSGSPKAPPQQ